MKEAISPRLGTFFILVGSLFLIIFIGSIFSRDINLKYLALSTASFFLATLVLRTKKKIEPTRFSTIRKIHSIHKNKKAEKQGPAGYQDDQVDQTSPRH